jgi:hypothetical protein
MKSIGFVAFAATLLFLAPPRATAQQGQIMGELRFSSTSKAVRDSGVWIDGSICWLYERAQRRQQDLPPAGRS